MLQLMPTFESYNTALPPNSTEANDAFEYTFMRAFSGSAPLPSRDSTSPLIYVVDDNKDLTVLYTAFLRHAGFFVRTFNERAEALASLQAGTIKPQLLITDYQGGSVPVERFIGDCRAVHPALRILMASGFHQMDMLFSCVRPNHFLQKPFTAEEFLREVRAALVSENANRTSLVSRR
jgi:DNA-binding NtrC family response regulator